MSDKNIKNIYSKNAGIKPVFSFEIFPPKNIKGEMLLDETLNELRKLKLDFLSITCGAGGSINNKTKDWSEKIQAKYDILTMPHYTSIGIQKETVASDLQQLLEIGINNIMALRGDLPHDYDHSQNSFFYANELIEYIRNLNFDFSIGAACYPEVHKEASSKKEDLMYLKKKVISGADFLITQLFFINNHYFDFIERCHASLIEVPIIPGIMPITNFKQIEKFTNMTGCQFPKSLLNKIDKCDNNPDELYKISVEYSLEQCQELLDAKVPGIHFYTLNQSNITRKIFSQLSY